MTGQRRAPPSTRWLGAFFLLFFSLLSGCGGGAHVITSEGTGQTLRLVPASFDEMPGWGEDPLDGAASALLSACDLWDKRPQPAWHAACAALRAAPGDDPAALRRTIETAFTPWRLADGQTGLFTGYYEASLRGSWTQTGPYRTPLWTKKNGKAQTPPTPRADVTGGAALAAGARPLLWVDDPVDAFFLEIQGSGRVALPDGTAVRVGYQAQNGQPYVAIGKILRELGALERPVTMAKIRAFLAAHPDRALAVMNLNPSVVYFRLSDAPGAVGAAGKVLTPLRALAVDKRFIPLGTPLWLDAGLHRRLVVALDVGGAIKGPVRGDLFWGAGPLAEAGAGAMQETGTIAFLWPKGAALP